MAQLWGGRFTKETDKLVYNFNASISFDKRFYEQDIQGSKAHVMMLAKQGILTDDEKQQILDGLESIRRDVESGKLEITEEYEDIHSFVEEQLTGRKSRGVWLRNIMLLSQTKKRCRRYERCCRPEIKRS